MRRRFATEAERKQATYERKKAWRAANPVKARASVDGFYARNPTARMDRHLLKKYGITLDTRNQILDLQGKACAICRSLEPGRRTRSGKPGDWVVDHNHATGKIRGIICHPCNAALGMVRDNVETLTSMVKYLSEIK